MEEEGDPVDAVDQLQHKLAAANIHIAKRTAELAACKSRVELLEHDMKELMDSGRIQRRTRGFYVLVPAMVEVESKKDKNWWSIFTEWR